MANIIGTNLFSINNADSVKPGLMDDSNNYFLVKGTAANLPSGTAGYAVGCYYLATDTGQWYTNTGTTSSCTFIKTNYFATNNKGYYAVTTPVSGTMVQNVFGSTVGFAGTITGVFLTSLGGTSSLVSLVSTAGTVAVITSSATKGTLVGPTVALANTALTAASTCFVVSTSPINQPLTDISLVTVTFTTT